jgi:fermentation-respiration switch protein FrsA (DUF1100 family)
MSASAIALLICGTAFIVTLYFMQPGMVYFPEKKILETPHNIGLIYEEVSLKTKDGVTISGWYIPAEKERGVLLFCHGNGGNISHRLDSIKIFNSLNLSVFIFDYRGYGKSEGTPTEKGTYLDAEAAWDYLIKIKGKQPEKIVVFGRSLGGAVAGDLALRKNPAGLIIESSFSSLPDIGKKYYPLLPVSLLSRFKYDTISKIGRINCPKLIIHSPEDEVVPYDHGITLFENALPPKYFLGIRGGHNDGFFISGSLYTDGLRKFLDIALPK